MMDALNQVDSQGVSPRRFTETASGQRSTGLCPCESLSEEKS
jgi:hypothetical protein